MNLKTIITAICSLLFFMVGADKFLLFLEPPCTMMNHISPTVWKVLGVLQLAAGVLIWFPKFRKHIAGFFAIFMLVFASVHLSQNTYDIGGAAFMGVLLGVLTWNPSFLRTENEY